MLDHDHVQAFGRRAPVLIDKTGTLTLGRPHITDMITVDGHTDNALLPLAATAEGYSEHLLARAVRDDAALRDIEEALEIIERSSEDFAMGLARCALGMALVHRESPAERERGLAVLGQVRDTCLHGRFYQLPSVDVFTARERARCGDRDGAIPQMCAAIHDLFRSGQLLYCVAPTSVLVETLLERGANGDVIDAGPRSPG